MGNDNLPILPRPQAPDERLTWEQDVARRYADLFRRVLNIDVTTGLAPTTDHWMSLAIALAIESGAAEFELAPPARASNRRSGDEQDRRDDMMDKLIWSKWSDRAGRWIPAPHRQMSAVEASKAVEKILDSERSLQRQHLRRSGVDDDVAKVPKATSIRQQYSQRSNETKEGSRGPRYRGLPAAADAFVHGHRQVQALEDVARRLGCCASLYSN